MESLRRWWMELVVLAVYVFLAIAMTWPLVLRLNSHFAGQDIDVWLNPWATWWTQKAISEGQGLYYTNWIFYPEGVSLAFHSFFHTTTVLALLMAPWLSDVGAHNATVILAHAMSGYGMFCLVRYLTRSSLGAFFAGLVFAFFPYRMAESIHPHIVSTQWLPLYFLFFLRLVDEKRKWLIIPTALFFVLNALSGWHLMTFAIFISMAYLCYLVAFQRWRFSKATTWNLLLLTGIVCAALAPFLGPLVWEQLTVSNSYVGVPLENGKGNDLVAFFLPAREHPVWGELAESLHDLVKPRHPAYLGAIVIGLSVIAGVADWKRARFWILLALLTVLLSIGPNIQIAGRTLDFLVPWSVPIVWLLRHPLRLNLLTGFALAVAAGIGLSAVLRQLRANRADWRLPTAGAMMVLLVFEYLYLPFPTTAAVVPEYYYDLALLPGKGAILELPMGRHRAKSYMFYQTVHNRPLVEGHVSRMPENAYDFIEESPILRSLQACRDWVLPPVDLAPLLNGLREESIEQLIMHKQFVTPSSLGLWVDVRKVVPDYEDAHIAVYSTQTDTPPSINGLRLLESCVAVRSLLTDPVSVFQGDILEIPVEWTAGNTPQQDYILELELTGEAGTVHRRHRYRVIPGTSIKGWPMVSRHVSRYSLPVDLELPPGQYQVQAALVPTEMEREEILSAHLLDLQVLDRPSNGIPPAVNATFGSDLRLHGYRLEEETDVVNVILHWQSLRRMDVDYKFFVHLIDVESGDPMAQADVMPLGWGYPTTWWEAEELVSDRITLSLEGVAPGTYILGLGVYDSRTGERLPIADQPAFLVADEGRLLLPEKIVR